MPKQQVLLVLSGIFGLILAWSSHPSGVHHDREKTKSMTPRHQACENWASTCNFRSSACTRLNEIFEIGLCNLPAVVDFRVACIVLCTVLRLIKMNSPVLHHFVLQTASVIAVSPARPPLCFTSVPTVLMRWFLQAGPLWSISPRLLCAARIPPDSVDSIAARTTEPSHHENRWINDGAPVHFPPPMNPARAIFSLALRLMLLRFAGEISAQYSMDVNKFDRSAKKQSTMPISSCILAMEPKFQLNC